MQSELPHIKIYMDGGCDPNPGPGGWAVILVDWKTGKEKEISGSESQTTNNRMELTAVSVKSPGCICVAPNRTNIIG